MMTFKELADCINKLTPEQQQMTATVSCDIMQEAYGITHFHVIKDDDILSDVLDAGHPVMAIDAWHGKRFC